MNGSRHLALILVLLVVPTFAGDTPPVGEGSVPTRKAPVPLGEAAGKMTVPEGFAVTLFAGEPDVRQPIALAFDDRGRLWVAECYSYPAWLHPDHGKRDRILIFEDKDGDGRFDARKVFWDGAANVTGLELGFGGVWVCSTPNLLFVPDRDGDDVPDGEPEVVLDGWDMKAQHNMFNGLIWGPDGWLWGCNGIMSNSRVGRPGTPEEGRVPLNCGVWRYHPTRKAFEVVAHGTTNPWGLDFDAFGEAFITNCVIPHLYHVVPGAHFERMYGQDPNPHSYGLIGSAADHIHWAGGRWQDSRGGGGKHGEAGGGHAHVGAMIYQGDSWPDRYRNSLFTCNVHGNRVNNDLLRREGSGYVASHAPDFLMAHDPWFRGIAIQSGPDGSAFLIDWSDTDECHETDSNGPEREEGRIYKITYGSPRTAHVDLARATDAELVGLQLHKNEWHVRHARRILQERTAAGKDLTEAHRALRRILEGGGQAPRLLRAIWALHVTGGLDEPALVALLGHESEDVRGWAVRLLAQDSSSSPSTASVARFAAMSRDDPSPRVRLQLASALQRLGVEQRWGLAEGLVAHAEDARDALLPLMVWYGVEPLVGADGPRAVTLAAACRIPLVREHLARRVVRTADDSSSGASGLAALVGLLGRSDDPALRLDLIRGMHEALRGRKSAPMPAGWPDAAARLAESPTPEVREQALLLALAFGDPKAAESLRSTMCDRSADPARRGRALHALVERRVAGIAPALRDLLVEPTFRSQALRALAAYDDPEVPAAILRRYEALTPTEKEDAVATLAARPASALALLDAIGSGAIPRRDLSVTVARQLLAFPDSKVAGRLGAVWGTVRPSRGDKGELMAKYKALLSPEDLKAADTSRGRAVFNRTCLSCHRLYDAGGDVGPELTGSDRRNLDYVLENILDPHSAVGRDYRLTTIATTDGRLVSGIVREENAKALVVQTANERIALPREEIEAMKPSEDSMMPEGILDPLSEQEVRDLVAYLATTEQVPAASLP